MVEQSPTRGFDYAHAFALEVIAGVEYIGAEDIRIIAQDAGPAT